MATREGNRLTDYLVGNPLAEDPKERWCVHISEFSLAPGGLVLMNEWACHESDDEASATH